MACSTIKEAIDELEMDISSQENVSQRAGTTRRGNKQHIRHRASIACFSCRDRRIRCVVPKGGSGCVQCKRSGTECVIKMDDERRRPISKAYVSSLSARIAMLEGMLQENGVTVPTAIHPPMTKHEVQFTGLGDETPMSVTNARRCPKSGSSSPAHNLLSPPYSHEDFTACESPKEDLITVKTFQPREEYQRLEQPLPPRISDLRKQDAIHRLLTPNGGLYCDKSSGRQRFFGPTANCHVYAQPTGGFDRRESPEQTRRAERIIRSLTPQTHDYLMQSFWKHHNAALQVVDRAAFEADRGSENPRYYSSFLHVIVLAIGWRFADKGRYDIVRMSVGNHESTIHQEAKCMLNAELERPTGIPGVQSLLLLGDLECGVGRDHMGWMYVGMANRLAFDMGLHTGYAGGICKPDTSIRRRVMKACILYDRHWALFLGRPTSIKRQDVNLGQSNGLASGSHSPTNSSGQTNMQTIDEEIHDQLVDLMGLGSQMIESSSDHQTPDLTALKQRLQNWHDQLPNHLKWETDTIRTAPCSYFLLHEQYQAIIILMHRLHDSRRSETNNKQPLNPKGVPTKRPFPTSDDETDSHDFATSLTITQPEPPHNPCIQAALQLSQIISQFKERFDLEKVCCTGLHPAGAASMALLTAIATSDKDGADRRLYLSSLEAITEGIRSMGRSYEPAARMGDLIQVILARIHPDARKTRPNMNREPLNTCAGGAETGCKDAAQTFSFSPASSRSHILRSNKRSCRFPTQGSASPSSSSSSSSASSCSSSSASEPPHRPTPLFQMPFDLCSQIPLDHTLTSMTELIPSFSDPSPSAYLCLDPYFDPALKLDDTNHHHHHHHHHHNHNNNNTSTDNNNNNNGNGNTTMGPPPRFGTSDTYLRVASSAKGWGLHSLHAATATAAATTTAPVPPFEAQHMADWVAGSGGAPTTTGGEDHNHNHNHNHETGFDVPEAAILGSNIQRKNNNMSPMTENGAAGCKREDTGGLVWGLGGGGGSGGEGASPEDFNAGLGDLVVQQQQQQPRNHELDFLSL